SPSPASQVLYVSAPSNAAPLICATVLDSLVPVSCSCWDQQQSPLSSSEAEGNSSFHQTNSGLNLFMVSKNDFKHVQSLDWILNGKYSLK
uniref:Uncharacterized protein n=1 Tax=Tetraodon nigroviridis TaxID=99883 RepID=H3BWE6_TETNG